MFTPSLYQRFTSLFTSKLTPLFENIRPPGGKPIPIASVAPVSMPPLFATVHVIASALASCPREVHRLIDRQSGASEPIDDHPLNTLLNFGTAPLDSHTFWEYIAWQYLVEGSSFIYVKREPNYRGRAIPTKLVPSSYVRVNETNSMGTMLELDVRSYEYDFTPLRNAMENSFTVPEEDLICLFGPAYDGITAPSLVEEVLKDTLNMQRSVTQRMLTDTSQGVGAEGVVEASQEALKRPEFWDMNKNPNDLKVVNRLLEKFNFMGDAADSRVARLPAGWHWNPFRKQTASQQQLIQFMTQIEGAIQKVYLYNPEDPQFALKTLNPHLRKFESQTSMKLLSQRDRARGYFVKFDGTKFSGLSWPELVEAADQLFSRGSLITRDEARRKAGFPPAKPGDVFMNPKGSQTNAESQTEGGNEEENDEEEETTDR